MLLHCSKLMVPLMLSRKILKKENVLPAKRLSEQLEESSSRASNACRAQDWERKSELSLILCWSAFITFLTTVIKKNNSPFSMKFQNFHHCNQVVQGSNTGPLHWALVHSPYKRFERGAHVSKIQNGHIYLARTAMSNI